MNSEKKKSIFHALIENIQLIIDDIKRKKSRVSQYSDNWGSTLWFRLTVVKYNVNG